jgi:hypothetical protein
MADRKKDLDPGRAPDLDYVDEYGVHVRIFKPVISEEERRRREAVYLNVATAILLRRAEEAIREGT